MEIEDFESWMNLEEYEDIDLQANYSGDGVQLVTFTLGHECYGIDILTVRELISYSQPSPLPNVPKCIKGVINLRGLIVPIVDLRVKFGMPTQHYDQYTVVIIIQVGKKLIGIIVDSVSDVVFIRDSQRQETPEFSTNIDTAFIEGIGQIKEEMVILLNAESMLSQEELGLLPTQAMV
ncbi:chemotaxis protein CheW [Deltaproteobacteria bacterium TL4]